MDTTMDRDTLGAKLLPELQQIAQTMGVEGAQKLRKAGLIDAIVAASTNGGDATKPARAKRNGAATAPSTETEAPATEAASDDDDDEADEGNRAPAREERAESAGNDRGSQDRGNQDRGNQDRGVARSRGRAGSQPQPRPWRPRSQSLPGPGGHPGPRPVGPRPEPGPRWRVRSEPTPSLPGGASSSARRAACQGGGRSGGGGQDRPQPHRHPRHPARGLWVPADRRLPARARGRLRVAVARAQALAAQGRHRDGQDPRAEEQREVPGVARWSRRSTTWTRSSRRSAR